MGAHAARGTLTFWGSIMVRGAKPRWGWEQTLNMPDLDRRQAQVELHHVARLMGNPDLGTDIKLGRDVSSLLMELYWDAFEEPGVSFEEMQATFDATKSACEELRRCVSEMDSRSRSWLTAYLFRTYRARRRQGKEALFRALLRAAPRHEDAVTTLDFVIEALGAVDLPIEPTKKGRKPNLAIRGFIVHLASILAEHTGKDPLTGFYRNAIEDRYEGPLVTLAEYILGRFAPDLGVTNASIGEHIRRTLGDRSKP